VSSQSSARDGQNGPTAQPARNGQTERTGNETHADIVDEHGHGHTVAAWAGVAVGLAGFLVLGLSVVFPSLVGGIIGGVIIVLALVVASVLSRMGYGIKRASGEPAGVSRPQH